MELRFGKNFFKKIIYFFYVRVNIDFSDLTSFKPKATVKFWTYFFVFSKQVFIITSKTNYPLQMNFIEKPKIKTIIHF